MPELPEIAILAQQMKSKLAGKTFSGAEVLQPKCLNIDVGPFVQAITDSRIEDVAYKGKWIFVATNKGWLLLSLGMGGEILLVTRDTLPAKYRLVFDFTDGTSLAVNFWWFGYSHWAEDLSEHAMTARLGPNALDLTADDLRGMIQGKRGTTKAFLMDQSKVAGIGNVYIQDILFRARLHPLRPLNSLGDAEIGALAEAIPATLDQSIDLGGGAWEQNLYGQKGAYGEQQFLVGYREGKPCPVCGTPVEKIRTGSTSHFICPQCQPLE